MDAHQFLLQLLIILIAARIFGEITATVGAVVLIPALYVLLVRDRESREEALG